MRPGSLTCITILFLIIAACASTLRVSKQGQAFTLGSNGAGHTMLCESGDLQRVLRGTTLTPELKHALTQCLCSRERSPEKAEHLYSSMTDEQQKDLRQAFKRYGYDLSTTCG